MGRALHEKLEQYAEVSELNALPDSCITPKAMHSGRTLAEPEPATCITATVRQFSRGDHVEMAEAVEADLREKSEVVFADGAFHLYDAQLGIWTPLPMNALYVRVQAFAGAAVGRGKKARAKQISIQDQTGTVKTLEHRLNDPSFFETVAPGIPFANGFASVTSAGISLLPHSSTHRVRSSYPFNFESSPHPRAFIAFLNSCFKGDGDAEAKIQLLQEFAGACMSGIATRYERALFMRGAGAGNGKSTALKLVSAAMPENTVLSVAPQEMGEQYRRAMFVGKLFNAVSELPERDILDAESFKAFVSGDNLTGRSPYEKPVTFRPRAGHMFGVNRLPSVKDSTNGFWRRPIIIEFNRTFRPGDPDHVVNIGDKILGAELPAIASWFLEGAVRLLRNGTYTVPPSHEVALDAWRGTSNRVRLFLSECTRPTRQGESGTSLVGIYDKYRFWCNEAGLAPLSRPNFTEELSLAGVQRVRRAYGNVWNVVIEVPGGTSVEEL